ncbi:MAG: phosphatidate cytidylyltransferase, partial [Thermoguttaceae bacterium]|nr:phosphatidate cytidylyltransferase [Thermoguttaceae bacterium]
MRRRPSGIDAATLSTCRSRVYAWWLLFGSLICALLLGTVATVTLFGAISFWALREYVTLTPTRPADHRTLVGVFFLLTPLQFILVGLDSEWFTKVFHTEPYFVFSVLIPSLAFLILPATVATSGDPKFFLERIAKLQVGLLICVYSLSFAPAILTMKLPNSKPTVTAAEIVAVDLEDKVLKPLEEAVTLQAANAGNNGASEKPGEGA